MHSCARKLSYNRRYRTERRRVTSYLIPNICLLICSLICGYYIYINLDISFLSRPMQLTGSQEKADTKFQGIFRQRSLLNSSDGQYPEDLFTLTQRRHGAVLLHILGLCYMFLAVALACDEFFVPALEVIIDRIKISEDVAGATFMAAGGSAPELFISLFGTFADPDSNVGIGTIVGSAVFNVLFVIGMCAIWSKQVLVLTWWPLFRDCIFYSIAILLLILFFLGGNIEWWESVILFCTYLTYVTFMKFNHTAERFVKNLLRSNKVSKVGIGDTCNPGVKTEHYIEKAMEYLSSNTKNSSDRPCFQYGAFQLVVNTIDPLWDASIAVRVKHFQQMSMSNGQVHLNDSEIKQSSIDVQNRFENSDNQQLMVNIISNGTVQAEIIDNASSRSSNDHSIIVVENKDLGAGTSVTELTSTAVEIVPPEHHICPGSPIPGLYIDNNNERKSSTSSRVSKTMLDTGSSQNELVAEAEEIDDIEDTKPIDLSWPDRWKDRLVYIIKAPIMFPMYCTMFDVRKPEKTRYFAWTFTVSILWIGGYSYLMVWWATVVGDTFTIPTSIMGLTFLAAGTSIPDLITSVLVARKGYGDMAVSSSIGSNMFDITVGLPVPWMTYSAINFGKAVSVRSDGLFCSVVMLFLMLISVVTTIAISKWRMSKMLGATMFVFYIAFIVMSLLLQFRIIKCIEIS